MNRLTAAVIFAGGLIFSGCGPRPVLKEGVDVRAYRKIGVVEFAPSRFYFESGSALADEFVRQLMRREIEVVRITRSDAEGGSYESLAREHSVDAILTGTVTKYLPDTEDTLYFRDASGDVVSEVAFRDAHVGASVTLIDGRSGEVVWTDTYNYRGFEIDNTTYVVADVIVKRMIPGDK